LLVFASALPQACVASHDACASELEAREEGEVVATLDDPVGTGVGQACVGRRDPTEMGCSPFVAQEIRLSFETVGLPDEAIAVLFFCLPPAVAGTETCAPISFEVEALIRTSAPPPGYRVEEVFSGEVSATRLPTDGGIHLVGSARSSSERHGTWELEFDAPPCRE